MLFRSILRRIDIVLRLPGFALDVDTPEDVAALTLVPAATRAHALLDLQRAVAVIGEPWA